MSIFSKSPLEQIIEGSHTNRQLNQRVNSALDEAIKIVKSEAGCYGGEESPSLMSFDSIIKKIEELKLPSSTLLPPPNHSSLK